MSIRKTIAGVMTGAVLATAAVAGISGAAFASDEDPLIPGGIYWFNTAGPVADQTAATQITSGENAANGGNLGTGRPWITLSSENACPENTVGMYSYIRIPQNGVPENDWTQVQVGAQATLKDAEGRFYTTGVLQADRLNKPDIMTYLAAQPGNTGQLPFISVCRDAGGYSLGYFRTMITMTGTTQQNLQWSIPQVELPGGGGTQAEATTTSLAAAAQGADLVLTATVSPTAAAGTVTFAEGGTAIGSPVAVSGGTASATVTAPAAGAHTYTATFTPTDAAAYETSTDSIGVVIGIDSATGNITVTVPEMPVVDGALTFAVPFDTPVQLVGSRTGDNSRVTATGAFPTVTVTDTRRDGLLTTWEVHAQAQDFEGSAGTFGAKYLGWTPATPTMTPDAGSPLMVQAGPTVASYIDDTASGGLGADATLGRVVTAGRGVSVLNSTLNLAIPGTTAEGFYTSVVTVTLVAD